MLLEGRFIFIALKKAFAATATLVVCVCASVRIENGDEMKIFTHSARYSYCGAPRIYIL
jgi:hypothetical protein